MNRPISIVLTVVLLLATLAGCRTIPNPPPVVSPSASEAAPTPSPSPSESPSESPSLEPTVFEPVIEITITEAGWTIFNDLEAFKSNPPLQPIDVPVLYYHSVSDEPIGIRILSVTTENFEAQVRHLLENGYMPIYMDEDPSLYEKPVILTFDDGYADNYTNLYPILEEYNVKATIFIVRDFVDTPGYLTSEQIQDMPLVSFQSHTATHRLLPELSEADIREELAESKAFIEHLTGKAVYALCYPVGKFSNTVARLSSEYYSCGVTIMEGVERKILGNFYIVRVFVSRDDTLETFNRALLYGT